MFTAEKQNLRFLGSLPIEPKIVQEGDMGNINMLNNDQLTYTKAFDQIVANIVKLNASDKNPSAKPKENKMLTSKKAKRNGVVIAIPDSEGKLSAHFGHCQQFVFVETESGRIKRIEKRTPPPHEPGVLPRWLSEQGATVIIAGGIGAHAQQILKDNGIEVVVGAPTDSPESLANQYLSNSLTAGENVCDH
jgi:predicted Fe-Mo cluster-binding NifX family protein